MEASPMHGLTLAPVRFGIGRVLPGALLTLCIAGAALLLHGLPQLHLLSALILAAMLGAVVRNTGLVPAACAPGQAFVLRRVLRMAIVLLGFQISLGQALAIGGTGLLIVVFAVAATFAATLWLGRRMGLDARFVCLIAAGTAVCGASAIVAANTVAEAPEEDVAYAIACVTVLGTASIFLYPPLAAAAGLTARQYGLWSGGSIHEVAQVVAAAFQRGDVAGHLGTVAKLCRVALLAPLVAVLALRRTAAGAERVKTPPPWFLAGFVVAIAVNSAVHLPAALTQGIATATSLLMAMALAAMGLATDLRAVVARGPRPLLLAVAAWLFVMLSVLGLVTYAA